MSLSHKTKESIKKSSREFVFFLHRKARKIQRGFTKNDSAPGQTFAILCVKKPEYVKLTINNINSLHFINNSHTFILSMDTVCYEFFMKHKGMLDYPENVQCGDRFGNTNKPWQHYKVETAIEAAEKGYILTDADGIWHDEPIINKAVPTFLVNAYAFKENTVEKLVLEKLFADRNALNFKHLVTGFLFIPSRLLTEELKSDMKYCTNLLISHDLSFLTNEKDRTNIHRLAEEIGICIALQTHYKGEIKTLTTNAGPKDKNILQSLYYGCAHKIIT